MSAPRSCWNCRYHQTAGGSFLGLCRWPFEKHKRAPREIPAHIVDKGCPQFESKQGELIVEKPAEAYEP